MSRLSASQSLVLSHATQRENGLALPLPERLRGGAALRVVAPLTAAGLLKEVEAKPGEPIWRSQGDQVAVTLAITDAGRVALEIAASGESDASKRLEPLPEQIDTSPQSATSSAPAKRRTGSTSNARQGTKQQTLIDMLRSPTGATIDEVAAVTGWQAHTVRGAIAGALKKRLGLSISSEATKERGRVYRVVA